MRKIINYIIVIIFFQTYTLSAQDNEMIEWPAYFRQQMSGKEKVPLSYYAKEDFTQPDTTHILRDVLFMGRCYIGPYGEGYQRLLTFFEATKKENDSTYDFRAVIRIKNKNTLIEGIATIMEAYRTKEYFPDSVESYWKHILLVKIVGKDNAGNPTIEAWFTAEMSVIMEDKKEILQYYAPAYYKNISFDNIFVGKIKLNKQWHFFQVAPDIFLMGNLPYYEKFMISDKTFEEFGADFKVCKIKPEFVRNGWQFTEGKWITSSCNIQRKFGYDWIPFYK